MRKRRSRWLACVVAVVAGLGVVGCSTEPEPEEVIREGRVPPGDTWCRLLATDEVQTLMGEVDLDRVRQQGDVVPGDGVNQRCTIVWADGDTPVDVAEAQTVHYPGAEGIVEQATAARELFGPDGSRLASGEVSEVAPGVYFVEARGLLLAHQACDTGASLPELIIGRLSMEPTDSGRLPTVEELAPMGEGLAELASWAHECSGTVRPLEPEDWQDLMDRYSEQPTAT